MTLTLTTTPTGVRVTVRAKPRATKSRIVGVREGALEVALAAPPVDGAANEELVVTLARAFDVPRSSVRVVTGQTGRNKVVQLDSMTREAALARLEALGVRG